MSSCRPSRSIRGTTSKHSDARRRVPAFRRCGGLCRQYLDAVGWLMPISAPPDGLAGLRSVHQASHAFNLLGCARRHFGDRRQSYILRVRELAKACGAAWLATEAAARADFVPF